VTYLALSGSPTGCVEFYGITVLPIDNSKQDLHLVFELAPEGTIWKYLRTVHTDPNFDWVNIVDIFSNLAWGLWDGLHKKGIAHGYV
jgi:hypothetical protein